MTPERKVQLLAQVAEFDRLLAERGVLVVARSPRPSEERGDSTAKS